MNVQEDRDARHQIFDGIDTFMKDQAIKDQRFYAAKVAFKGPQLLNGMAPSYCHLKDLIWNIRSWPSGRIVRPNGFLLMSERMRNMWTTSLDNFLFHPTLFGTPNTPVEAKSGMTFEKMMSDVKEMMKDCPPVTIKPSNWKNPFKFTTDYSDLMIHTSSPIPHGLSSGISKSANLQVFSSKHRPLRLDNKDYYVVMPMDFKFIDAAVADLENKDKEPNDEK